MNTQTNIIVSESEYKFLLPLLFTDEGFYMPGILYIISEPFTNWVNVVCEDMSTRKALAELITNKE